MTKNINYIFEFIKTVYLRDPNNYLVNDLIKLINQHYGIDIIKEL